MNNDEMRRIITAELEELASNFEGIIDSRLTWTGQELAVMLRERIKNHHFYEGITFASN